MRRIIRENDFKFWEKLKKNSELKYSDLSATDDGKEYVEKLRRELVISQKGLCAYCCRKIEGDSSSSHNEHIKPQSRYLKETMDIDNIVASCNTPDTCGMKKGDKYDEEMFISPLDEDCESHFSFSPDGKIEGLDPQGEYMISLLNLNTYSLKELRATAYKLCRNYHSEELIKQVFLNEDNRQLHPGIDAIKYFYDEGVFRDGLSQ